MLRVILYTCQAKTMGAPIHPCANAAKALDDAGYAYEVKTVRGFKRLPFSRMGGARDEIKELSGQEDVPILVLGDGDSSPETVRSSIGPGPIPRFPRPRS